MFNKIQRQIEKLLDIKLPFKPGRLHFAKWQPNPDLVYFQAYIKIEATEDQYLNLIDVMSLHFRGQTPEADIYLPASWACESEDTVSWWDPTFETPADAAARAYGVNGWIIAKYENGAVFIIVTDTGNEQGSPGPL
jgi:hypothetical protein